MLQFFHHRCLIKWSNHDRLIRKIRNEEIKGKKGWEMRNGISGHLERRTDRGKFTNFNRVFRVKFIRELFNGVRKLILLVHLKST